MKADVKIPNAVVVNDDATQLKILCGLLEKAGVEYKAFNGAKEALASIDKDTPPEIIITDIYMPGIDGWRFCRMLRSSEYKHFNHVPILVVSATFSGDEPSRITSDLGANAFLSMPVDGKQFIETVHNLLSGKKPQNTLKILIVEDSKMISKRLITAFQSHGYQTDEANTLSEAQSLINDYIYDVAVIDYHLPDGQGDLLIEKMKTKSVDSVCIMTTADEQPELALEWMRKGAAAYIKKPFDTEFVIIQCEHARRERALLRVQDLLELRTSQLSESEFKFRQTFDVSPAGIVMVGLDSRFILSNLSFSQSLGYEAEELVGKLIADVTLPEDRHIGKTEMMKIVQGEIEKAQVQKRYLRKDGQVIWGEVTISLIRDTNGQGQYFLAIIQNITERKQTEEKLVNEATRRRILMEQSTDGIVILDQYGKVYETNRSFAEMLGYPLEKMDQLSVFDWEFLHTPERTIEMLNSVDEKGDHFETKHRRRDGSVYNVEISTNAAWFDGKKLIFCVCRDITERKRLEQELKLKSLVLDQIQDHVSITDLQGNITYVNEAEIKTMGISRDQLIGKATTIYGEDAEKGATQREIVENTLRDGRWRCEIVNYSSDGKELFMDCRTQVIQDTEGKPIALCGIATDVTKRKQAEQALYESEERYRLVDEASQDLIYSYDLQSRFTHVNTSMCKLMGLNLEQIIGKTHEELGFSTDQCCEWERLHQQVYETNSTVISETKTPIQGGELQYFEVVLNPIHDNTGAIIGIAGTTRDINARKQAEAKINEQLNELRRWHNATLGREDRIIELKREINNLLVEVGKPPRYSSVKEKQGE